LIFSWWLLDRHGKIILIVALRGQLAAANDRFLVVVWAFVVATRVAVIKVVSLVFFTSIAFIASIAVVASIQRTLFVALTIVIPRPRLFSSTSRGDRRCRVASRVRRHHRGRRGSVDCCDRRGLRVPIDVRRRLVRLDVDGDRRRHDNMINTRRIVRARVIRDARDSFDAPRTSRVGRSPLARRLRVSFETMRWLFFAFLAGGDIATAKLS
jgi:hypothetical protein